MEEKKKVLIITYYWPPSGGAGVQRWFKFAKYLTQFGWEPLIISVDENKASYPVIDKTLIDELPPGIKVFRTDSFEPLNILTRITGNKPPYGGFANKDKGKISQKILRFVRGNFFLPDARKGWTKYAFKKAVEIIRKENIKVVVISSPPHSSQLIGLKFKKQFPSLKWVADMRDPWTDIYYYKELMHTRLASEIDKNYEKKVLENADEVVVVSEDIKRIFLTKSEKISKEKVHVLPNGYDETDFVNADAIYSNGKFIIGYIGTMTDIYKPELFFSAANSLIKNNPGKIIELLFVGNVAGSIMEMLKNYELLSNCNFIKHVPHSEAVAYMKRSSILFLAIPDIRLNKGILTGKLFEYMASRRPILCLGPEDGDAAKIIREANTGEVCDYADEKRINQVLKNYFEKHLHNELRSESINIDRYSRRSLTKQLVDLLERITV